MSQRLSRRRYIVGAGAAVALGALAGCADDDGGSGDDGMDDGGNGGDDGGNGGDDGGNGGSTPGAPSDDVPEEIDDYLADADGYDGTIADYTGADEVVVDVGAGDIGFAFEPAAIRIDAGTTVRWEWTGEGGAHNVESAEGSASDFSSGEPVDDPDETFEQSFDDAGIQLYLCTPHEANGMLGAIEVVE
ncbi:halocyanin domain-containing protein [Halorubrum sp. DTA46]|uniref:halocyanin domain-containing protein n=1 Tax=Halorubrum sp. DTA46 TaxID=3402162 RepID=UPI003AAAFB76